ncbi:MULTISPECIES: C40 family peptidase [unclassified Streptomyces]|uniref:C40 family peptidase n=1 Tax=unclassified Streptomyces TaxID=2593676 RepID=UPI0005BD5BDC|nr:MULTISPECIES: C40 family peptidase [unclassified Streptomyces]ASY33352.1 glycoside hydrolase [Streptomyces sp. CLI2509]MYX23646.1 glycoside hydrolase [Streptomyces sp. SID8380]
MPHTAQIPSHRKPRRSASRIALRAGVASGVLGTLAVAGATGSASAAEPVTETIEMPTLTANLSAAMAAAADSTQQMATSYELRAEQDAAVAKAAKEAKADRKQAEKKAEEKAAAKKKAAEEAAAKRAAERETASRSAARTTLAPSTSASTSTSSGTSTASTQSAGAPASGSAASVIAFLKSHVGDAYVMGGTGPHSWDCSGLTQAAFRSVGVDLPRTSQEQSTAGTQVSVSSAQPGDLLYWGGAGSAYHVGVYIGNGQYLDAANPGKGVVIQDLSGYPASGAIRLL